MDFYCCGPLGKHYIRRTAKARDLGCLTLADFGLRGLALADFICTAPVSSLHGGANLLKPRSWDPELRELHCGLFLLLGLVGFYCWGLLGAGVFFYCWGMVGFLLLWAGGSLLLGAGGSLLLWAGGCLLLWAGEF